MAYFEQLFATSSPSEFEEAVQGLRVVVTEHMNAALDTEPTAAEIREALFQMHPTKAPGPDGMHALFFQTFWDVIGDDIVMYVKLWWRGNVNVDTVNLDTVNKTIIALIPKCKDPQVLSELRPISCCNVIYKIVSKVLANKLKPFLGDIISNNQSAFIPQQLITDNALIAFETFHAMKRRGSGRNSSFALKLDMSKAYDRVEWSFLERVMIKMGFSDNWIRRILSCISSVSFAVKVNGCLFGDIILSRGLRQGDPISPYLFLICAEAFSTLITRGVVQWQIHGVRACNGAPPISHLFFADDSILFAKASLQERSAIANIISLYEKASGQNVNYSKTEITFSKGVSIHMRENIMNMLGAREVAKHDKYLGLPTLIGRLKKLIFTCLKDRIWKKIQGWKENFLSRPGKEVLIKAIVQAIPTYMMSIFRIPDGIIDDIHSMLARFWWGSNGSEKKVHWHSWDSLCRPKGKGGMGFRNLKVFNHALLAKQLWRIHSEECPAVADVLKARYYKHSDVLSSLRGYDPSFT